MILKFRAWLKKEQKMDNYIDHISWLEDELYCIGDGITYMVSAEDLVLMQSTGLKDKNGKEIFEGDILEIEDEGEVLGNAKLTWHNEQAVFMIEAISVDDIAPFHEILSDESYSYRVVGNVYENPELFEEKE
ncbi:YopX family protein [Streptococcus mitis]|uniref:YopX family protein n=1 Tax=Streptococcus mitis TaxID=28037 RepID=UPI0021B798D3|nr:YopX family protein [Streptococcus mitis]